jgi:hypothetical protein
LAGWRVTVRHASDVEKKKLESLDEALAEARSRAAQIISEGGLGPISALRDFSPEQRVHARIELSGRRFLRGPAGGIDIRGDGSVVPYTGQVRKQPLEASTLDSAIEGLREALRR